MKDPIGSVRESRLREENDLELRDEAFDLLRQWTYTHGMARGQLSARQTLNWLRVVSPLLKSVMYKKTLGPMKNSWEWKVIPDYVMDFEMIRTWFEMQTMGLGVLGRLWLRLSIRDTEIEVFDVLIDKSSLDGRKADKKGWA